MLLEGSCHCGAVRFSVNSKTPYPFSLCYCSICRKTSGGGGFAINIMGEANTLKITGKENISTYRAAKNEREAYAEDGLGHSQRHFCHKCGTQLWVFNPTWPELVHPFASAIDTPLPPPPERRAIMLKYATDWAVLPSGNP